MFGIAKPCRHTIGAELHREWMSHLCGLCLGLRDALPQRLVVGAVQEGLLEERVDLAHLLGQGLGRRRRQGPPEPGGVGDAHGL